MEKVLVEKIVTKKFLVVGGSTIFPPFMKKVVLVIPEDSPSEELPLVAVYYKSGPFSYGSVGVLTYPDLSELRKSLS